jgi:hypothetical protein
MPSNRPLLSPSETSKAPVQYERRLFYSVSPFRLRDGRGSCIYMLIITYTPPRSAWWSKFLMGPSLRLLALFPVGYLPDEVL